jgi:hypothetical protein
MANTAIPRLGHSRHIWRTVNWSGTYWRVLHAINGVATMVRGKTGVAT